MDLPSATVAPGDTEKTKKDKQKTFLIVDDSAVIRRRLVSMLAEIEDVVLAGEAANALDGAALIRKLRPDVVILDIRMPDRSGISLLEDIKQDSGAPTIIVLTNYPYAAYQKRCMELGASHFFDKSSEFTQLEKVVRNLVEAAH